MKIKKILVTLLSLVIVSVSVLLVSFDMKPMEGDNHRYYYVFESNGKMGFMDEKGREVIAAKYYSLGNFSEGLASAKIGDKWGFIDTNGREAVGARFDGVAHFVDGVTLVWTESWEDDEEVYKYGYVDKTGKVISEPQYREATDFSEGLAAVNVGDYNDPRWGYIDRRGEMVISPIFTKAGTFSEGLASVEKEGKRCYIDKSGKVVLEVKYSVAGFFSEGLAMVGEYENRESKLGYIDKSGREVIPLQYAAALPFEGGVASVKTRAGFDVKWEYIDREGNRVMTFCNSLFMLNFTFDLVKISCIRI